jgi:ElaB/YqjD/DUF883 family membrane-anchored ribosome-binding protein
MANPINRGSSFPQSGQKRTDQGGVMGAVKDAADKAGDALGEAKDTAQKWASSAAEGAQQAWDYTGRQAQRAASGAAEMAEECYEGFAGLIRRYPVASVFVALGVGFMMAEAMNLGMSASRRSRR